MPHKHDIFGATFKSFWDNKAADKFMMVHCKKEKQITTYFNIRSVQRIIDRLVLVSMQEYSGLDIPWTKVALTKRFGNSLNLQIFLSPINAGVLRLLVKASRHALRHRRVYEG